MDEWMNEWKKRWIKEQTNFENCKQKNDDKKQTKDFWNNWCDIIYKENSRLVCNLLPKRKYNSATNIRSNYMSKKITLFCSTSIFIGGFHEELFVLFVESWIIFVKNIWAQYLFILKTVIRICEQTVYGWNI